MLVNWPLLALLESSRTRSASAPESCKRNHSRAASGDKSPSPGRMVRLQISASVAENSAAMGDTIHVTSHLMQLPVKQRNFGLPTEESGERSRSMDHGSP